MRYYFLKHRRMNRIERVLTVDVTYELHDLSITLTQRAEGNVTLSDMAVFRDTRVDNTGNICSPSKLMPLTSKVSGQARKSSLTSSKRGTSPSMAVA